MFRPHAAPRPFSIHSFLSLLLPANLDMSRRRTRGAVGQRRTLFVVLALVSLAAVGVWRPCAADFSFGPRADLAAGSLPRSIATDDLNGDGKLDLVIAVSGENSTWVYLGNGNGTFRFSSDYATGTNPYGVAIGDLNLDGRLDLAISCTPTPGFSFLLGNGDGTFGPSTSVPNTFSGTFVALGHLNGDALLDAVTVGPTVEATVLLNLGGGSFAKSSVYVGNEATFVALVDLNNDAKLDLVANKAWNASGVAGVYYRLGNGDGTFGTTLFFVATNSGVAANNVAMGDLNSDGNLDIATSSPLGDDVGVVLGNGDGTFRPLIRTPIINPEGIAIADLNGDGRPDLALGRSGLAPPLLSILPGNGDGTFWPSIDLQAAGISSRVAIANLNGDAGPDIVSLDTGLSLFSVFLKAPSSPPVPVTVNANPVGLSVTVDGTSYGTPQTFMWDPFSIHAMSTVSPQAGGAGTQYAWTSWSDGGSISHMVQANGSATKVASFKTQYLLAMSAAMGGTVSPTSGFRDMGSVVSISASSEPGYGFDGWAGSGTGSYTGSANPVSITLNGPITEIANFLTLVSIQGGSAYEGSGGPTFAQFLVTLAHSSSDVVAVDYTTMDGTATVADMDYVPASGTLTFQPGETSMPIPVTINADAVLESDESFSVLLSNPAAAVISGAVGVWTIKDDELLDVPNDGSVAIPFMRLSPNPTSGAARIEYGLPEPGRVRISVYDVLGRMVARPVDGIRGAGKHETSWAGPRGPVLSGVYLVRLEGDGWSETRRLLLVR